MWESVREERLETDLLSRLRRGDAEALRTIYEGHSDAVYRVALRITASSADAYDVTHDVFLGLPEAVSRYDPTRSFMAWLTALMRIRSEKRRREVSLAPLRALGVRPKAGTVVDRLTLENALVDLPPELRTVFVLREIEGLRSARTRRPCGCTVRGADCGICYEAIDEQRTKAPAVGRPESPRR